MFNASEQAERMRNLRKLSRRHPHARTRSKLDHYSAELLALHDEGLRPADLQRWLKLEKSLSVEHSTVARWLRKQLDLRAADQQPRY